MLLGSVQSLAMAKMNKYTKYKLEVNFNNIWYGEMAGMYNNVIYFEWMHKGLY